MARRAKRGDLEVLSRAAREARPYRGLTLLVMAIALLGTPIVLLQPVPIKLAVDSVLGDEPIPALLEAVLPSSIIESTGNLLVFIAMLQILVIVLLAMQISLLHYTRTVTGERMTLRFRARLMHHAQKLSFAYHDKRGTADSIYRIQWDAPAIQWLLLYSAIALFSALIMLIAMLVVILNISAELGIIAIVVVPLMWLTGHFYRSRMRSRYEEVKRLEGSALGVIQEVLTSFRLVKAYGRENYETDRFVSESRLGMRQRIGLAGSEGRFGIVVSLITGMGTAAVLFVGVISVQSGTLTLGDLLLVLAYLAALYAPLQSIAHEVMALQDYIASTGRAFHLLDQFPTVASKKSGKPIDRAKGDIRFERVSFAYAERKLALKQLTVSIPAGSRVGVAGETGAGKSTMVSLLARFFDPTKGRILLDGTDLRDLKVDDLREQFAFVLQSPVLFATSIAENIRYAKPDADWNEIVAASQAARAHEFISSLPEGYATEVGEHGLQLSGGERQRISLARAFLKDAPMLVLDEPTSALDTKTEAEIISVMDRLIEGRTSFVISHRHTMLDACDFVLELAEGRLDNVRIPEGSIEPAHPSKAGV